MIIKTTFERWLQRFDSRLRIMKHATNPDIDVLYLGKKRLCSVPKGLKTAKGWSRINDKRSDAGYVTSDGIAHRSLSGIGLILLARKIITPKQFVQYFITQRTKDFLNSLIAKGVLPIVK